MVVSSNKKTRMLEIFFRAVRGEKISVKELSQEYEVSSKSISRDIAEIKNFFYECRELTGNAELKYSQSSKSYYLELDDFLTNKELVSIVKVLIGSRAFSKNETQKIICKFKKYTTQKDREVLEKIINNEIYHYKEVNHDCRSVISNIWSITEAISNKNIISIEYYKMTREKVSRKVVPLGIIFSEYYFYMIAYRCDKEDKKPIYYRIDRITSIKAEKSRQNLNESEKIEMGDLANKIQYMYDGKIRKIKFEYYGKSVQAILDKIPLSNLVEKNEERAIIEAEVYGKGINMVILSQGSNIKVLEPEELRIEIEEEIKNMQKIYLGGI